MTVPPDAARHSGSGGAPAAPLACDVAVCGAGLGGLALAVGLARRGFDVHVFEASHELYNTTGTLIWLGTNAFSALDGIHPDLTPRVQEQSRLIETITSVLVPARDAEPKTSQRGPPGELWGARWPMLQEVLSELLPPQALHFQHKCTGYTEDEEGGGLARVHFEGRPDVRARLVVGADGVRSSIRAKLIPQDPGFRYLGHMNWNALLHQPALAQLHTSDPGELISYLDVPNPFTFKIASQIAECGAGFTFWQVRLVTDVPQFTVPPGSPPLEPPQQQEEERPGAHLSVGDDDVSDDGDDARGNGSPEGDAAERAAAGAAALQNGHAANVAGGHKEAEGAPPKRKGGDQDGPAAAVAAAGGGKGGRVPHSGGLGRPGSKARVEQLLRDAGFQRALEVVQATPESSIYERAICDRLPLDELGVPMHSPKGGRVVLVGDAAHPLHPGLAQGARLAFEDAFTLARLLEERRAELEAGGWARRDPSRWDARAAAAGKAEAEGAGRRRRDGGEGAVAAVEGAGGEGRGDREVLLGLLARYSEERLSRTCRVQRFSAEGGGSEELRGALRPGGVGPEHLGTRLVEFGKWLDKFPSALAGDPDSQFWRPESEP